MKQILFLLLAVVGLFSACSEKENVSTEYANWQARNQVAFIDTLRTANAAIAQAKAQWGDDWQAHCDWRTFRSYALAEEAQATWKDSIAVRVLVEGQGSGTPLYSDTVRVVYVGRLMPTEENPKGLTFDYSGVTSDLTQAFHPQLAKPAQFAVSNVVEGFSTALQHMHIGDRWRLFMPAEMAYEGKSSGKVPAYSMLIYDTELRSFWRVGNQPISWQ